MHAHQRVDRHIEGLRAVAVIAVVLHHAWPAWLPGGFVGVDVFFLISGYLIGKQLIEEIREDRFSFLHFYARRARRLFPALAVVLLATWWMGWQAFTTDEFEALGRHILAAAAFSSNVLLWSEAGYFDAAAQTKPLRHLWSLAVEEQFYLLLPLLLWWGGRGGWESGVRWAVRLGVASLVAVALFGELHPQASFYLLPARLWELLAGVAVGALELQRSRHGDRLPSPTLPPTWAAQGLCILATLALAWSITQSDPGDRPGLWLILPVAGAALLLGSPARTVTHRLLAVRPLVFIGAISYPLYLWHWPLLVFWRAMYPEESTAQDIGLVVMAAAGLAWLTKVLVEDPVRRGHIAGFRVRPPGLPPVTGCLACAAALGATGVVSNGLPSRLPPAVDALARWREDDIVSAWRIGTCFFWNNSSKPFSPDCTPSARPGNTRLLLWGDSHAAHLLAGLEQTQAEAHVDIVQWTAASCPPTLEPLLAEGAHCAQRRDDALRRLQALAPDTVILAAAWTRYLQGRESQAAITAKVGHTLRHLRQIGIRRVVLVGHGPTWQTSLPADLVRHMIRHRRAEVPRRFVQVNRHARSMDQALREAARSGSAHYLSLFDLLCNDKGCLTMDAGASSVPDLLFRDEDHLTRSGSLFVARHGRDALLGLPVEPPLSPAPQTASSSP